MIEQKRAEVEEVRSTRLPELRAGFVSLDEPSGDGPVDSLLRSPPRLLTLFPFFLEGASIGDDGADDS